MKNSIFNFCNLFENLIDEPVEKLDLTKDDDYKKFNESLDKISEIMNESEMNPLFKLFLSDDLIDELRELGKEAHDNNDEHKCECKKQCKCNKKTEPELPSSKCTLEQQANIHKIVTEYVETIIRPNTNMSDDVINDAYAGLYEFACWVLNK